MIALDSYIHTQTSSRSRAAKEVTSAQTIEMPRKRKQARKPAGGSDRDADSVVSSSEPHASKPKTLQTPAPKHDGARSRPSHAIRIPLQASLRSREFLCIYAFIVAACTAVYSNSLHGDFMIDDSGTVLHNPDMQPDAPLTDMLKHDFWGTPIDSDDSHKSYRPITTLTFRWTYAWSGADPFGYHVVNVVLHITATVLFTWVAYAIFTQVHVLGSQTPPPLHHIVFACASAAAVFAVHPVHVEAVANVTGRAEMLTAVFVFTAFLAHNQSLHAKKHNLTWFAVSSLLAVMAVFCKETGLTVIAVNLSHHVSLALPAVFGSAPAHKHYLRILPLRLTASLACVAGYLIFRKQLAGSLTPLITIHDNALLFQPPLTAFLSALNIHTEYARLLTVPVYLSNDYSYNCIPMMSTFTDPRLFKVVLLYAVVIYTGVTSLYLSVKGDCTRLLCLAWLVFPFVPASHALRVATTVGERLMYLPSAGLCLLLSLALMKCMPTDTHRKDSKHKRTSPFRVQLLWLLVAAIVALYGLRAHSRSADWINEDHLHETDLQVCPNSARLLQNVGVGYFRREEWAKARPFYERAFAVIEDDESPHSSMGIVLQNLGEPAKAVPYFETAVELHPRKAGYAWNLGAALVDTGQRRRGVSFMEKSLQLYDEVPPQRGDTAQLHLMGMQLGTIYHERRNFTGAKYWYRYAALHGGDSHPELVRRVGLLKEHSQYHSSIETWEQYAAVEEAGEKQAHREPAHPSPPPPPPPSERKSNKKRAKSQGKKSRTTANKGVERKIIKKGNGPKPKKGQTVSVHCTGRFAGKKFWSTKDPGQHIFSFRIGLGQVIRGWDEGVMQMKQGEVAVLTCSPEYGYGSKGFPAWGIPPNAVLAFEIELLEIK